MRYEGLINLNKIVSRNALHQPRRPPKHTPLRIPVLYNTTEFNVYTRITADVLKFLCLGYVWKGLKVVKVLGNFGFYNDIFVLYGI